MLNSESNIVVFFISEKLLGMRTNVMWRGEFYVYMLTNVYAYMLTNAVGRSLYMYFCFRIFSSVLFSIPYLSIQILDEKEEEHQIQVVRHWHEAIPTTPAPTLATAPLPFTAVDATYETNTNMFWRFDQNSMGFPNEARNGGLLACFDVSNVPVEMKQAGGVCTLTAGVSGYASIGPNNRDCLQMGDLTPKSEALCVVQPDTCAHGVSLSLWVKTPQAHSQTFNKHMLIASVLPGRDSSSTRTGIDLSFHTNIGQNVRYLTFKLTTLSGYYEVQTPWLYWDKWTNLGLRWSQSTGLSAYINGTNVGFVGSPTANTGTVEEATHLTLGCYLNNLQPRGEETGRYEYTAKGVQVDDFAVFLWYLRETELSFFHGGCGVTELNAQPTTAPFDYTSRLELFNWTENVEHEPFYDVATKSYSLESTSGFTVQGTINTVSTARSGATSKSVLELGATSSYLQLENLAGRCAGDIASCTDGMAMAAWLLIPSTVSTSANSLSTIIQCDQRAASGSGRFVGYGVFWENGTLTVRVGKSSSSEGLKFTVNSVPRDVWFNVGFGYHPDFGLSVLVDGDAAAGTASEETAGFTDHQTGTLAPGILVFGGDGGDSLQGALASRVVLWERYVYPCEGDTFLGMNERVVKLTKSASHVWSNLVVDLDGAKTKPLYITNGSSVALVPGSGRMGRAIRVAPDTEGWMVLGKIFNETIDQTVGKFTGSCLSKPSVCNTGLSFNMYLKINAIPTVTGHQYIICSGAQHSQSEGFFISMSGGAIWTYLATNTHTWITKIEASRITTGQWMHVGFSWNPTDGLLTFLNGNVVGSSTTPKAQSRLVDYLDRITIGRSNANDDMEGFEVDFTFEDIAVYEEFVPEYLFRDKFKLPESSYYEDIGSNLNWNPKSMLSSHLADLEDYSLTQSSGRLGAHNQVSYLASGVTISNSLNSSLCSNIKLAAYSSGACLSNPGTACSGFTVALWVKINEVNWEFQGNDTVNNTYTILRTFTSASQTGFSMSLYGQYWQFVVKSEAKDWTVQTSSKMVPVGKWVNVGFTWNAVDGLVAYINGVMEGVHTTGTTASPLNMPANSMLTLGCHSGQDARVVSMKAYSVHVWPMAVLPSNRPFRITGMSDAQIDKFNMNDYYWALDGPISKFSDQQLTTHGGATIQEGDISSGQGVKTTSGGGYASLGNFNGECIKDINVCSSGISVGLYMKLPTTPSGSAAALFNSGGVQIWKDGTSVGVRLYKGTRMYTRVMTNAPVDTWFHFVLQWSPDLVESQSIKFYKDGQEVSGSTSAANVAPSVDNNPVYLGRPFATATIAIDAHFDEITISYTSDFLFTFTDPCFASATSSFGMTSAEQYLAKSGTTPAADRNGKANGAILVQSGYINIGTVSTCLSNPALCPDGFTIAFKVKLKNRGSNNYDYLFSSGYSFQNKEVGGNGLNRGIAIAFKISGVFFQVRAYLNDGTTTWDATVTGVPINQWITIGLTWRRTNTEGLVMLLDDVRKDPPSNAYRVGEPATLPAPATSNVFLARANFIESPSFPGTIVFDSVAFYNQYSNFSDPLTRTILKGESCDSVVTVDTNDVQVTTVTPTPFVAVIPTTVPPSTTAACSPALFYKGTCYTNRIALFDAMSTNNIESSQRNETALSETLALAIVSDINNETTANSENEPKTATQLSEVALAIRVLATSDLPASISRQNARDRFQAAMDAVSQNTDASNAENLKQITVANADVASQISNLKKYITRVAEKMPPVTNCSASNTVSQNMVLNMIDVIPECAEETTFPLRESSDVNSTLEGWGQPQDSIVVPPNLIPGASGLTIGIIISNTAHESISNEQAEGETAMKSVKVHSRVVEMFIVPELPSGTTFASPVVFTLEHLDKTASGQRSCNYWKEASGNVKAGWASDGCERNSTNVTHTVCHCYHFTTFAVLLDQDTTEPDHFKLALSIITWVTMAISMGSLIFFIVILVKAWERLLDDRGIADINLAVAIFFASLWFCLLWTAQDHLVYCQALSILMHYFYLTSFAWLVMEAVCLFSIIISGVLSERALKIYMPVAWGVPALVVTGVAVVALPDHGHKERCWLSHETMYFWAFPGAIIAFMVLTALILLVVMCNFSAPAIKKKDILLEVKQTIRNIMLLLLYLGLTWLFGIISLTIPADRALDFTFIIFNGFQGFFFFLTFGVGRNSFRDEVKNTFQKQTAVEDEDIANSRAVSRASNSSTVSLTQVEDIRITPRLKKDNDGWSDGSTDSEEEMAMAKKKKMQARHKAPAYVP
ncbi:uncharacterized protein LOC106162206 [Lingula anatina]|uniref:Uncharacterized protein LOC106162206 n=1 Tax=Lingula anatina TaxID=7574 RepID=A0A1S3I9A0_LINAN|nr:uncharacterized protein LOC106162206 [Lingula anatina]|eukprot:XP_013394840.1 uncharacterized protein LOC106162206 [Lingula anatina]